MQIEKEIARRPTILCPFGAITDEEAQIKEKQLITYFGRQDLGTGPLLNLTAGGDGGAMSPIVIQKRIESGSYSRAAKKSVQNYWDNISPEEYAHRIKRVEESYTPELRKHRSIKQTEIHAKRSAEEKTRIALKSHETRRLNKEKKNNG